MIEAIEKPKAAKRKGGRPAKNDGKKTASESDTVKSSGRTDEKPAHNVRRKPVPKRDKKRGPTRWGFCPQTGQKERQQVTRGFPAKPVHKVDKKPGRPAEVSGTSCAKKSCSQCEQQFERRQQVTRTKCAKPAGDPRSSSSGGNKSCGKTPQHFKRR